MICRSCLMAQGIWMSKVRNEVNADLPSPSLHLALRSAVPALPHRHNDSPQFSVAILFFFAIASRRKFIVC